MTSNLQCVGLGVDSSKSLGALVRRALPESITLGVANGVEVRRWEDSSGSRLILGMRDGDVVDLLPSFAGQLGAKLGEVNALNDTVNGADLLDESGEQVTSMNFELEENRFFRDLGSLSGGSAVINALGLEITVHANAEEFSLSPSSLLDDGESISSEPPAVYVERGWDWPPRVGSESFIPTGQFGTLSARGRLYGTVLSAGGKTCSLSGGEFVVTVVRTVGFIANLCTPLSEVSEIPVPGNIVGGAVYLVVSIPSLTVS